MCRSLRKAMRASICRAFWSSVHVRRYASIFCPNGFKDGDVSYMPNQAALVFGSKRRL